MSFMVKDYSLMWGGMTRAVRALLFTLIGVFVLQLLVDYYTRSPQVPSGLFMAFFSLIPEDVQAGMVWKLFTYMFLHSEDLLVHIFFNVMLLLAMGPETERLIGAKHFLYMFFLSGFFGGVANMLLSPPTGVCIGASGAIFGILGVFSALKPNRRVYLLFFPFFPFRIWKLMLVLGLVEFIIMLSPFQDRVAHEVHLGGLFTGVLYAMIVFRPEWISRVFLFRTRRAGVEEVRVCQDEVDVILEKVSESGMHSLTPKERELLQRASRG